MKTIDSSLLNQISGGRGNNGGDRSDNGGRSRNNGRDGGRAPKTCANDVGISIITGALTGIRGGPWAMVGLAVAGAVMTGISCSDRSSANNNNNRDALAGNRSPNSVNGQCRW